MKKILATAMILAMGMATSACTAVTTGSGNGKTDLEYVKDKGKLIVGITEFAPMDYKDDNGNWIGFDADMATAFAEELGVEVEFVLIDWDNKALELESKTIDCVWNGMTLTQEVLSAMDCSVPYCTNSQIVIVPGGQSLIYNTTESISELNFAVESGSAGQAIAESLNLNYTEVLTQADALMEVAAGTSEAAIVDSLMAKAMIGEGTSYDTLAYTVELNNEEYGVGFRKGSELVDELNKFFASSYKDGSMQKCAEKYNVQKSLVEQ